MTNSRILAHVVVALLLASPAACARREHRAGDAGATPLADAGVITVPNQLRGCADLPGCEDACKHGSAEECLAAAYSYSMGDGGPPEETRSAALFEAACALRSGPGCTLAGRAYEFAHGVPRDFARALSLYRKACSFDYQAGCYNVAVMLENGRGTERDTKGAADLYRKVCEAGSGAACEAAARLRPEPPR